MRSRDALVPAYVRTLFIDMDGTLLDLAFDRSFFRETLPLRYAQSSGLDVAAASAEVHERLGAIEGTLAWYSLAHLSRLFALDLAAMTEELAHGVSLHAGAIEFLAAAQRRFRCVLVTNADPVVLELKLQRTGIAAWMDGIVSAHHLGAAKEEAGFYRRLAAIEPDCPAGGALIDDNLKAVAAARAAGLSTIAILRPDRGRPARSVAAGPAVASVADLIPYL